MRITDGIELHSNILIQAFERGKRRILHESHNIFTDIGRQFICENITASSFSGSSFVRTQNTVVRYIGFGVGGNRQTSPSASATPISTDYPGTNTQTDTDVTVSGLERPVKVTSTDWMKEVSTPGTFGTTKEVTYIAVFSETDLTFGSYTSVPISEIGLYKSSATLTLPNGSSGSYPGAGGHIIAYDAFNSLEKTARWTIQANWTLRLG